MTNFSQNDVWDDTLRLVRTHWRAFVAIAGVFNFLPVLLVDHFIVFHPTATEGEAAFEQLSAFLRHNLVWWALQSFVIMIGNAAILRLIFARDTTIGGALWYAILLLPAYSLMSFFAGFAIAIGAVLFVIPGLYLCGRLLPAAAAMVAEDQRNSIEALRRAFALTQGRGWQILLLYILVAMPGAVLIFAVSKLSGIVFILAAGQTLGLFLAGVVTALFSAGFNTLLTVLTAAMYRALVPTAHA